MSDDVSTLVDILVDRETRYAQQDKKFKTLDRSHDFVPTTRREVDRVIQGLRDQDQSYDSIRTYLLQNQQKVRNRLGYPTMEFWRVGKALDEAEALEEAQKRVSFAKHEGTDADLQGMIFQDPRLKASVKPQKPPKKPQKTPNKSKKTPKKPKKTPKKTKKTPKKTPKESKKTQKKKTLRKKLTPEVYQNLIERRKSKTRLTPRQKKQLDNELFVNYCKCIKRLKYDTKTPANLEYPVCASSVYTKRGFPFSPGTLARCKHYK